MRLGTMLSMPGDSCGTHALIERAVAAEAAGFASCWLPQVGTVDALMALALAGRDTRTIELGTALVPTYPRHPMAFAAQARTVDECRRDSSQTSGAAFRRNGADVACGRRRARTRRGQYRVRDVRPDSVVPRNARARRRESAGRRRRGRLGERHRGGPARLCGG